MPPKKWNRGRKFTPRNGGPRSKYVNMYKYASSHLRTGDALATAVAAYKLATYVRGLLNVEKKLNDVSYAGACAAIHVNTPGTLLTGLAQGDTRYQRNGAQVKATSLFLRMLINLNTAGIPQQRLRLMIVRDISSDGAAPLLGDILNSASIVSPLNTTNSHRFKVIKDNVITVDNNSAQSSQLVKQYYKFGHKVKFSGTSAAQTDCTTGHVYLFVCTDNVGNDIPIINYFSRFRYIDN